MILTILIYLFIIIISIMNDITVSTIFTLACMYFGMVWRIPPTVFLNDMKGRKEGRMDDSKKRKKIPKPIHTHSALFVFFSPFILRKIGKGWMDGCGMADLGN